MVCVLQAEIVPFCQVEMVTNQVKKHLTRRARLKQTQIREEISKRDTLSDQGLEINFREEGSKWPKCAESVKSMWHIMSTLSGISKRYRGSKAMSEAAGTGSSHSYSILLHIWSLRRLLKVNMWQHFIL